MKTYKNINKIYSLALSVLVYMPSYASYANNINNNSILTQINLADMCITSGKINEVFDNYGKVWRVKNYGMRAVSNYKSNYAGVKFRYIGNSDIDKPLASGEMRRQIALKLNAKDSCNLIYIAWHIEPTSKIAVSVKINPNMSTHKECGTNGYNNLKNQISSLAPINKIKIGEWHTLEAKIDMDILNVYADKNLVWSNNLPSQALNLIGPNGVRTDNASFDIHFFQNINYNEINLVKDVCQID